MQFLSYADAACRVHLTTYVFINNESLTSTLNLVWVEIPTALIYMYMYIYILNV